MKTKREQRIDDSVTTVDECVSPDHRSAQESKQKHGQMRHDADFPRMWVEWDNEDRHSRGSPNTIGDPQPRSSSISTAISVPRGTKGLAMRPRNFRIKSLNPRPGQALRL